MLFISVKMVSLIRLSNIQSVPTLTSIVRYLCKCMCLKFIFLFYTTVCTQRHCVYRTQMLSLFISLQLIIFISPSPLHVTVIAACIYCVRFCLLVMIVLSNFNYKNRWISQADNRLTCTKQYSNDNTNKNSLWIDSICLFHHL